MIAKNQKYYLQKITKVIGESDKKGNVSFEFWWETIPEARAHIKTINHKKKRLRLIKKQINQDIKIIRLTFKNAKQSVKAGFFAELGGSRSAARDRRIKREGLRKQEQPQLKPLQTAKAYFDSVLIDFDKIILKIEEKIESTFPHDMTSAHQRETIPDDVLIFVWNRDDGKCVKCGSNKRLEYDHIIPVSKGGSNTARNIQLLCENCNRSKGDRIGG